MRQGKVPEEWRTWLIVPIWKKKGDVQDPGKYRGITLLSHIMKLLKRILNGRIRKKVEQDLGEEQQGFRKGRATTNVCIKIAGRVEVGDAKENGSGICGRGEGISHSRK